MKDRDDFLAWVKGSRYRAELALHKWRPRSGPRDLVTP